MCFYIFGLYSCSQGLFLKCPASSMIMEWKGKHCGFVWEHLDFGTSVCTCNYRIPVTDETDIRSCDLIPATCDLCQRCSAIRDAEKAVLVTTL